MHTYNMSVQNVRAIPYGTDSGAMQWGGGRFANQGRHMLMISPSVIPLAYDEGTDYVAIPGALNDPSVTLPLQFEENLATSVRWNNRMATAKADMRTNPLRRQELLTSVLNNQMWSTTAAAAQSDRGVIAGSPTVESTPRMDYQPDFDSITRGELLQFLNKEVIENSLGNTDTATMTAVTAPVSLTSTVYSQFPPAQN